MLILLGVGTKVAIDGKIFDTARTAVDTTNNKVTLQESRVNELADELDSVIQSQCKHEWSEWDINSRNCEGTRKCSKCNKIEKKQFPHTFEEGVCTICKHKLAIGAKIIGYNPAIGENGNKIEASYISEKGEDDYSGNGYGEQVFKVSGVSEWRVLKEENGQIVILMDNPIQSVENKDFYLYGKSGYLNSIQELNNISGIYGLGKYADTNKYKLIQNGKTILTGGRSITIEDVGIEKELTGTTAVFFKNAESGFVEKNGEQTAFHQFIYYDLDSKSWKDLEEGKEITVTQFNHSRQNQSTEQLDMESKNFSGTKVIRYWGAYQYNYLYNMAMYCTIAANGNVTGFTFGNNRIYSSNNAMQAQYAAVRPVVYLKLNVAVVYNEESNTYNIVGYK